MNFDNLNFWISYFGFGGLGLCAVAIIFCGVSGIESFPGPSIAGWIVFWCYLLIYLTFIIIIT